MGLVQQAMQLSEKANAYFKQVQKGGTPADMLAVKGKLLLSELYVLQGKLSEHVNDEEIGLTAMQVYESLNIEKGNLTAVINALSEAKTAAKVSEQLKKALKLKTLEERLRNEKE